MFYKIIILKQPVCNDTLFNCILIKYFEFVYRNYFNLQLFIAMLTKIYDFM